LSQVAFWYGAIFPQALADKKKPGAPMTGDLPLSTAGRGRWSPINQRSIQSAKTTTRAGIRNLSTFYPTAKMNIRQ
jgi:hypothetical protein